VCALLLTAWLIAAPLTSAQVTFEATTESLEVTQGNQFEVTFALKNAEGIRFKAPDFGGLRPVGGVSEMRGMNIVNGRATSTQSWSLTVEAIRTGTFTVGPAVVIVAGKPLATQPLPIQVVAPRNAGGKAGVPPGSDGQIFVVGELDQPVAYAGEQVAWRVKLYTLLPVEGFDVVELPDFEGMFHREKRRFDTRVQYQTLRGKKYAVKTLHEEAIFPNEAGEVEIGIAQVRVGVERSGRMGPLLGPVAMTLQTRPVVLRVKALPEPVPANFSGCVGRYTWEVSVDRDSLDTDNAFTLTMAMRGNGDTRHFAPPKWSLPAGLEAFDPKVRAEEAYENSTEVAHEKTLDYVVLPKEPGRYTLWPEFVFFDPDSNRYQSLHLVDSLVLTITPGAHYQPPSALRHTLPVAAPAPVQQPGFWEKARVGLYSYAVWGILFVVLAFVILMVFRKKQATPLTAASKSPAPASAPRFAPPPKPSVAPASKNYLAEARRLLTAGVPRAFYDALYHALQTWLTERIGLSPARLDQRSVQLELVRRNIPEAQATAFLSAWQTCEEAIFAGQAPPERMAETLQNAELAMRH